ncbi:hypothetical protein DB31_6080 [Hyalangium minutum]|uniref:Uncharacterized protein n=1 Tax=Hyalangium minutum TaxID=394096 RepID=A0A085VWJ4_9BACT|nr:hypothetical protein DB31_6080 [Hyalangium minutum]
MTLSPVPWVMQGPCHGTVKCKPCKTRLALTRPHSVQRRSSHERRALRGS